jgi:two-component system, NtrC family, response regulator GlrR
LVDDDPDMREALSVWLRKEGFKVNTATSRHEALTQVEIVRPHMVVTDLVMEEEDSGMRLLTEIHRKNPLLPVIMLSGQANPDQAFEAAHLGLSAFLTKSPEHKDHLSQEKLKERLIKHIQKTLRILGIEDEGRGAPGFGKDIICRSAKMAELMEQARLVAETDITVFIHGETGTGKELLAKSIHQASPRRDKSFIGINCGAIPEQLLESELFGHEKGAFTGAATRHEGLFQAANGGTLFLDEIGDMPLGLQVKLLRVLQEFQIRPVGSVRSIPIDVRVISATHNDLEEAVRAGEFREDLYYRLNVVPLYVPSLAERREDIPLLLEHFLAWLAKRQAKEKKRFAPDAMEYLVGAPWPGNVRQLVNVVELCATLTKTEIIPLSMAQRALRNEPGNLQTLKDAKQAFERDYLLSVLRITQGHVANAARIAGRNRTEFYKLLSQHNIDPTDFRKNTRAANSED